MGSTVVHRLFRFSLQLTMVRFVSIDILQSISLTLTVMAASLYEAAASLPITGPLYEFGVNLNEIIRSVVILGL